MLLLEQARDLEEGARVLRDDVGRIPPGPVLVEGRDVAIGKGEALDRGLVRRPHDVEIDARGLIECRRIHGLHAFKPGGHALRDGRLPRRRAVGQPRLERRARPDVDAEAGRILRVVGEHLLADLGEQGFDVHGFHRGASLGAGRKARKCREGGARPGDEFAATGGH